MHQQSHSITLLLSRWRAGDSAAGARVMQELYVDLRQIATRYFRCERRDHTLQATAVLHEAWLRIAQRQPAEWRDRAHFIGLTARVMRRVLVEHARERAYLKRGGDRQRVTLAEACHLTNERPAELIELDEALDELARLDPGTARLVELRFFGGLSIDEAAVELGIARPTAVRHWRRARAWLYRELKRGRSDWEAA